jgi:hypothetical protein
MPKLNNKKPLWDYSDYTRNWLRENGHNDLAQVMEKEFKVSLATVAEVRDTGKMEGNRLNAARIVIDKVLPDRVEINRKVDRIQALPTGKLLDMMEKLIDMKNKGQVVDNIDEPDT